ncbi:uncharacterized protein LOC116203477 isoform X1 [Punica granatum]|uniref:Uncharacterized protein LOC116203477 isoform X1 n=1 Tax=Punica granatum TaxID=22663 RepID=A0A6P8D3Q1_PUNGR|nr:uncharacterized protein LOC116203477 isoform X1 [Punica granatum]
MNEQILGSHQKKMNVIDVEDKTTVITDNRVIISVYTESAAKFSERKTRPIRRAKALQFPGRETIGRTAGYNRRAQLLGYAGKLRSIHQDLSSDRLPGPKQKRRSLIVPERLRILFDRMFRKANRRWRYERIVSDENAEDDGLRSSKCMEMQRKKKVETEIPFTVRKSLNRILHYNEKSTYVLNENDHEETSRADNDRDGKGCSEQTSGNLLRPITHTEVVSSTLYAPVMF